MEKSEKQIETYLRDKVKAEGGRAYKLESPGSAGMPDRLVLLGGAYFIELKSPVGKPTPLQKKRIRELSLLGQVALVIGSCEEVDEFLEVKDNRYTLMSFRLRQAEKYGYLTGHEDIDKKIIGLTEDQDDEI